MYFVLSRAVTCGTVDCTFVRADAWLDFSRDLVSLWSKTRQGKSRCGDCSLVTTARTPSFSKNRWPRPRSMWQPRSLRNSFDSRSGAPPGSTCTRSAPSAPAIPTGSMARVLVSSVSSLPKTEGLGLLELEPLYTQTPSSCEHLFPLFESVLSNQEA